MRANPEFVRNLWIEFLPHRLVAMPVILGVIAWLDLLTRDGSSDGNTAAIFFVLIVLGWGTRQAATMVTDELDARTWDGQRMSAVGPWEMTWGKLYGGAAYMWYGGLLCLVWFTAVRHGSFDPSETEVYGSFDPVVTALYVAFGLMVGGIAHAVSLLMSLSGLHKRREVGRRRTMFDQTAGLAVALILLSLLGTEIDLREELVWYGGSYSKDVFVVVSLAAFTAWAMLGAHLMMRLELQMENGPWAWFAFVIFGIAFAAGFSPNWAQDAASALNATGGRLGAVFPGPAREMIAPLLALSTSLLLLYLIALIEAKSPLDVRRLAKHLRFREWSGVTHRLPRTALTALVAVAVCLWAIATASSSAGPGHGAAFLLAVLLFALRDIGFIYYLNLGTTSRRADMLALLYLALLYSVVPMVIRALSAEPVLPFFWPSVTHGPVLTILPAAAEVVLVYALLAMRVRKVLATPV